MNNINIIKKSIKSALKYNYNITYTSHPISEAVLSHIKNEFTNSAFSLDETVQYINKLNNLDKNGTNTSCLVKIAISNTEIHSGSSIILNILSQNKSDVPPYLLLQRVIKRLYITSSIFNINKNFVFWLIPTNKNRVFPTKSIVMPKHINGGFTYINGGSNVNIYIYRREEFPKVMLHELMHHSLHDTNNNINDPINNTMYINKLKTLCGIHEDTTFLTNEGIIEAWTLILQCIYVSYEYNIPFNVLINSEKKWSLKQTSRILYHKKKHLNNVWKETSNAYCYIVFKTFFIHNIDRFIYHSVNKSTYKYVYNNIIYFINNIHPKKLQLDSFRMSVYGDL